MAESKNKHNIISRLRNDVNYGSVISLQHAALTKIAIELWKNADIPNFTLQDSFFPTGRVIRYANLNFRFWWSSVENRVESKLIQLSFPKYLQKRLQEIVKNVGVEILTFLETLQRAKRGLTFNKQLFLLHVQWTSYGTLDYVKSISSLVKHSCLNRLEKIALSCYFCLENYIWDLLTNSWCQSFHENRIHFDKYPMITYWINRKLNEKNKGEISIGETTKLLKWAILNRNENAVKYIYEYYNHYYKNWTNLNELIMYAFEFDPLTTTYIICYLISKINKEHNFEFVFIHFGDSILKKILKDSRLVYSFMWMGEWMMKLVPKMSFYPAFQVISLCHNKKVVDRFQFKTIVTDFVDKFKTLIIEIVSLPNEYNNDTCSFLFSFEDKDYLKCLLKFGTL